MTAAAAARPPQPTAYVPPSPPPSAASTAETAAIKRRPNCFFFLPSFLLWPPEPTETGELNDDEETLRVFCGPVWIGAKRLTREGSYDRGGGGLALFMSAALFTFNQFALLLLLPSLIFGPLRVRGLPLLLL